MFGWYIVRHANSFRELDVYKLARKLANQIYGVQRTSLGKKDIHLLIRSGGHLGRLVLRLLKDGRSGDTKGILFQS